MSLKKSIPLFLILLIIVGAYLINSSQFENGEPLFILSEKKLETIHRSLERKSEKISNIDTSPTFKTIALDKEKVIKWLNRIMDIKVITKRNSNFVLAGKTHDLFVLQTKDSFDEVYIFTTEDSCFIKRQAKINNKLIDVKMGYISSLDCAAIKENFNKFRHKKIQFSKDITNVTYVNENKKITLSQKQKEKFTELMMNFDSQRFIFDGEPDSGNQITLKLGKHINNNLQGYFLIDGKKLITGRPDNLTLRVWLEGNQQVLEGKFPQWRKLKNLENELLK